VIDRPLTEGGAERIAIPLKEVQGLRYQPLAGQHSISGKAIAIAAVIVGVLFLVTRALLRPMPERSDPSEMPGRLLDAGRSGELHDATTSRT
jgi:hypothetical protein